MSWVARPIPVEAMRVVDGGGISANIPEVVAWVRSIGGDVDTNPSMADPPITIVIGNVFVDVEDGRWIVYDSIIDDWRVLTDEQFHGHYIDNMSAEARQLQYTRVD